MATARTPAAAAALSANVIALEGGRIMDLTNLVSGVTMDVATALKGQQVTVHTNDSHYDLSLEGLISQQFLLHLEHCFNGRDSQALNREVAEFVSYIASFTNFDTTLLCKEFI